MERYDRIMEDFAEYNADAEVAYEAYLSEVDPDRKDAWYESFKLLEKQKKMCLELARSDREAANRAQPTGPQKLSLPDFLKVNLPKLDYTHSLSTTKTDSRYALKPSSVTMWTSFTGDVANFAGSLDATDKAYSQPAFPDSFMIQSEEDVRAYTQQHIWQPLEQCPTPLPFDTHVIRQPTFVGGLKGVPDWVALGYAADSGPQLLLAIEAKTHYSMPVPDGTSVASLYADNLTRPLVQDAVHQLFGYLHANGLRYGVLLTGEVYAFVERQGSAVRIADIRGEQSPADSVTPQMGVYYLLHRAAADPGEQVISRSLAKPRVIRAITSSLGAAVGMLLRPLTALPAAFSKVAGQLTPNITSKDVYTWDELNLTGWIGQGRTGSVFEGCIGGSPVAVKVCDYGHRSSVLEEVQRECQMLDHLRDEQGQAVPRKVTQGFIAGSTCYFVATELLGESLQEAPSSEHAALEQAALAALDKVHARGVLHRDVRPQNFLRAAHGRVVLTDFGFSELSDSDSARQQERAAVHGLWRRAPFRHHKPALPAPLSKLVHF